MTGSPSAKPPLALPPKALIGMVHVAALPGTPAHNGASVELIASAAASEAAALARAGFDALIVENMHDRPYAQREALGPEITAAMTRVVLEVQAVCPLPIGVQILSGGAIPAVAVAAAADASFIRCENFVFAHVADEGLMPQAEAGPLLRYRRNIGAQHVAVLADIKKKHASHAITADVSIERAAEAAEFFGADAVIVTGGWTGEPAGLDDLRRARAACDLPVMVGSGATPQNIAPMLELADAVIIGTAIKRDGLWSNPVDPRRCDDIVRAASAARSSLPR